MTSFYPYKDINLQQRKENIYYINTFAFMPGQIRPSFIYETYKEDALTMKTEWPEYIYASTVSFSDKVSTWEHHNDSKIMQLHGIALYGVRNF